MKLLKFHVHLNHVQLAADFMSWEIEYDDFLPEYTAIVQLSEEVHPYLSPCSDATSGKATGGLFRFDVGIIYPLVSCGFLCNAKIRWAISKKIISSG